MFKSATSRRLARATRLTVTVDLDTEEGTVTTRRPAKRSGRCNVERAAIWASQTGIAF